MDLKETDLLGENISDHWYYQSKARAITNLLGSQRPRTILDVGAGSGFFSKYLLRNTDASAAWCVDISYPDEYAERVSGKRVEFVRSIDKVNADLVLLMDVLEHVDDDVELLAEYVSKVPPGSRFVITVPAFNFLWSPHDEFLEHRRRYTLRQLETVVASANLEVATGAYYFGAVFPIAASIRLVQKLTRRRQAPKSQMGRHNDFVNQMLLKLCEAELPLLKRNRIGGLSVCCLARKRASASEQSSTVHAAA